MSEQAKENLSALLDNELDASQANNLNQRMQEDSTLRVKLNRYALISESLKGSRCEYNAANVADSVSQALANEPTVLAPSRTASAAPAGWKTYFGGAAVAATVAALAVMNISSFNSPDAPVNQFPVTVDTTSTTAPTFVNGMTQRASTRWTTESAQASPEVEAELNQLLMEHSEYTKQTGVPGLLPYATIVVYDKQKN